MSAAELRAAIEGLGITQAEAAFRCGVNLRTVQRWVGGERKVPPPVAELVRVWVARAAA